MQQPENEIHSFMTRETASGRKLTYHLEVCQQPDRARACGSGPKSQADRRPIDPPPVVRFTIHEGNRDITQNYDATFMLTAMLENCRPIAGDRVHQPATNFPVLAGQCVAGAAYLQKPVAAAYFIFPDISVRHEGWYRLKFFLFEQTKTAEWADPGWQPPLTMVSGQSTESNPMDPLPHETMHNRLQVYSVPFQVFSAKKFPGLIKSTDLSIEIASQGCRVRIRREIRQRRSDKNKKPLEEERKDNNTNALPAPPPPLRTQSIDAYQVSRQQSCDAASSAHPYPSTRQGSILSSLTSPITAAPSGPSPFFPGSIQASPLVYAATPYPPPPTPQLPPPMIMNDAARQNTPFSSTPLPPASLPQLPPIQNLLTPSQPALPPGGLYSIPTPAAKKRGLESKDTQAVPPLKDHARPSIIPASRRHMGLTSLLNHDQRQSMAGVHDVIRPDENYGREGYEDSDNESEDSLLDEKNMHIYKRADGRRTMIRPTTKTYMDFNEGFA